MWDPCSLYHRAQAIPHTSTLNITLLFESLHTRGSLNASQVLFRYKISIGGYSLIRNVDYMEIFA